MSDTDTKPTTKIEPKIERPKLYRVILVNDDFTPRDFVTEVLKAVFRMTEEQAYRVMMTAHRRGVCVVAVFTRDWPRPRPPRPPTWAAAPAIH